MTSYHFFSTQGKWPSHSIAGVEIREPSHSALAPSFFDKKPLCKKYVILRIDAAGCLLKMVRNRTSKFRQQE